jgi:hypothetical protein
MLAQIAVPGQVILPAMATESEPSAELYTPDPASVFAAAHSLWESFHKLDSWNDGMVGFMSDIMHVATLFENWACDHVMFEAMSDVWPYLLQDEFGEAVAGRAKQER